MKDIPFFTTENGAAGLVLREISYRGEAFIHIHCSENPGNLLDECISFCRICGAKKIYVSGPFSLSLPLHTIIYEMEGTAAFQPEKLPTITPVSPDTAAEWREIYNKAMMPVANAATLTKRDEAILIADPGACWMHEGKSLLGIGWIAGNRLRAVASCVPGRGGDLCRALQSLHPNEKLTLEVASANTRAMRLYEHLGFHITRELSRWYRAFEESSSKAPGSK